MSIVTKPKIELGKRYRTKGEKKEVKILSIEGPGMWSVIGHYLEFHKIMLWDEEGFSNQDSSSLDLEEIHPLEELEIDSPVLVSSDEKEWFPAHFAGFSKTSSASESLPMVWIGGETSFTVQGFEDSKIFFPFIRLTDSSNSYSDEALLSEEEKALDVLVDCCQDGVGYYECEKVLFHLREAALTIGIPWEKNKEYVYSFL